jgi:CheY-like chemotaxis protein
MQSLDQLKILIADDNDSDRMILSSIIKQQGHCVIEAYDGINAVEVYQRERPDIVLLDVIMPNMDGMDAAKAIKSIAGEKMVPIIFLTSLTDASSLAKCLDSGGDDFLSKPYNKTILQAKINDFSRMRNMHATLQKQRDIIAINNKHLLHEQQVAKAVFDNVAHSGCLNAVNLKHHISPLAIFNGDVLLAARKPSGGMHLLLGDFTGHGLPAAIGAMPLAEVFYGMTAKGFSLTDITREINAKLKSILPLGVFCCACVMDLSFRKKTLEVWLGGLPDCYLYRSESGTRESLASTHLPLGVLGAEAFDASTTKLNMDINDRFFAWSDGIHEARNASNEMFGDERLMKVFEQSLPVDELFDGVLTSVENFVGSCEQDDDLTLFEVSMVEEELLEGADISIVAGSVQGPMDWKMTYELRPETLKNYNPLPLILHVLMEVPGLRPVSGQLYTLLVELFSNAFEHGVLELDSSLKKTSDGFAEYYKLRTQRINVLSAGEINITLDHKHTKGGGRLIIIVEDSGNGFDISKIKSVDGCTYYGRGINLIASLCNSFEFQGKGNIVQAELLWNHD